MSLAPAVIGILTQNHHFYPIERSVFKCIEYEIPWRIDGILSFLLHQEVLQRAEIGGLKLFHQNFFPSLLNNRVDSRHRQESYQK